MPRKKGSRAPQRSVRERKGGLEEPETPAAQMGSDAVYPDDDDKGEEQVEKGAMAPSSDPIVESDEDTIALARGEETQSPAQSTNAVDMGASQSHQDVSKDLRGAAQQLRGAGAKSGPGNASTGRLKRPSMDTRPTASKFKRLAPKTNIQRAVYDAAGSADTPVLPPHAAPSASAFSPLRKQRKVEQSPPSLAQSASRRSRRVQGRSEDDIHTPVGTDAREQDALVPDIDNEDSRYRDFFPDAVIRQYAQAEPDNGDVLDNAVDHGNNTNGTQAQKIAADAQPQTDTKRKRGRPRKGSSANDADHPAPPPPESEQVTAVTRQTRRSARQEEALANLNRRKTAEDGADNAAAQESEATQGKSSASGEDLPKKPVVLCPSEVHFGPTKDAVSALEQAEDEPQGRPTTQKHTKRKAASQSSQANTAAKRRKRSDPDDDEDQESEKQETLTGHDQALHRRLWGQWVPLRRIHRDLKQVGANIENGERLPQNQIELEDGDVKAIVGLCKEAVGIYRNLQKGETNNNEPADVLAQIERRVAGLQGRNEEFPTDFDDRTKTTNIYYHLVPTLVKVLWAAVDCYKSLDERDEPAGQLSMGHLQIVDDIATTILETEVAAAKKYKARPETGDAVVRSVHNGIAVPLRRIEQVFRKVLQSHRAEVRITQRMQQEAEQRALRLEQEERRSRQAAELNRIRQKWEKLHLERWRAEGSFFRREKGDHLRMPDPNLDIDAHGNLFRRVSLFHPRVGPPPGLLDAKKSLVWTEGELWALTDGLRVYAGSMVYERLIRAWCPRGKMLNKYNVIEIVAAAENVKEWFVKEHGEDVEDWVKAIPVWSKSHAVGEENEESLFVDADEVVGGDPVATAAVTV